VVHRSRGHGPRRHGVNRSPRLGHRALKGPPFGGRRFVADNSVWQRADKPAIAAIWAAALRHGQIATCPPVRLEILFSARGLDDFDEKRETLAALENLPTGQAEWDAAEEAMRRLLEISHHRAVTFPDLLVAATAEAAGIGVLHYDSDFDLLRDHGIFNIDSQWVVPPGTAD
jgi:predicted nucleic acid-binding protein